jgi:hypothetical protein
MKRRILLVPVLFLLTGCADTATLMQLPTGEIVNAATDRWGSWERVRKDEEKTKQKIAEAEKARADSDAVKYTVARENVRITIDSKDELYTYALSKANDNLAEANRILGEAIRALSGKGSVYADLPVTPAPKGAFAEGFESFSDGFAKIANTPVGLILGGGLAAKWIIDKANAGAGNQFNLAEGDLNSTGSFNKIDILSGNESPVSIPYMTEEHSTYQFIPE